MPPEAVEQLLDAGPKSSPFRFLFVFLQIRCSECFCTTVVRPMMMAAFDVMFSGKSVYVSRRLMAIEPMTLHLLLICEVIHDAERRDQNLFNFFTSSFFWT